MILSLTKRLLPIGYGMLLLGCAAQGRPRDTGTGQNPNPQSSATNHLPSAPSTDSSTPQKEAAPPPPLVPTPPAPDDFNRPEPQPPPPQETGHPPVTDQLLSALLEVVKARLLREQTNSDCDCGQLKEFEERLILIQQTLVKTGEVEAERFKELERAIDRLNAAQTALSNDLARVSAELKEGKEIVQPPSAFANPKLWLVICLALFIFLGFMQTPRIIEARTDARRERRRREEPPTGQ